MGKRHVGPMEHRTQIRVSAETYNKLAEMRLPYETWDGLIMRLFYIVEWQRSRIVKLSDDLEIMYDKIRPEDE